MSGLAEYLAGGNDGPGGSTMRHGPKPCVRCGAQRPPGLGRGRYYCAACEALRDAEKAERGKCAQCGAPKPAGRGRRFCDPCQAAWFLPTPCSGCKEPKSKAPNSRYCFDCRDLMLDVTATRERALQRLKSKMCRGGCRRKGPFHTPAGNPTPYCRACRAVRFPTPTCKACGVRPIRSKHAKLCAPCKAASIVANRAAKAEWTRQNADRYSRRRRHPRGPAANERQRMRRALLREQAGAELVPVDVVPKGAEGIPTLPAAPLAARIELEIARCSATGFTKGPRLLITGENGTPVPTASPVREAVCDRLGIAVRNLHGWSSGERATVQFDTADRVLTRAGWCWWDVWTPEQAQHAFEGQAAA